MNTASAKSRVKSIATWITTAISVALVVYVVYQGVLSVRDHDIQFTNPTFLLTLAAAVLIVLAGSMILPANFARILLLLSGDSDSSRFRDIVSVYCKTQIFKYLPGNVFHFLGRQVYLKELSFRQINIANTTLVEILGLACTAALLCLLLGRETLWALLSDNARLTDRNLFTLLLVALVLTGSIWLYYFIRKSGISFSLLRIITTAVYYACYFLSTSIAFWLILNTTGSFSNFHTVTIIFMASWLLGFITPGASAGIGLREAAIYFLGNYLLGENLAFAALVLRLVTILGDTGQWLTGHLIARSSAGKDTNST